MKNEPYTIAAQTAVTAQTVMPETAPEMSRKNLMATVIVLTIAIAGIAVFTLRRKPAS
ncbi:MAG: hypothetical protein JW715_10770 [Sedimentisphaerales bacterium]|nr:hypothetical protein [Sedimentisphaerales bacterium]